MSKDIRSAFVTGGSRGIGLEVCRQLASLGWRVFAGVRVAGSPAGSIPGVEEVVIDVSDPEAVSRATARVAEIVGEIHGLVNNAGIFRTGDQAIGILDPAAESEIRPTLEVNLFGAIRVAQAFRELLAAGRGRVVNVSSGYGQLDDMDDGHPGYGISKTALNAVTRKLASAFRSAGVAVNSVCPGWCRTDMGGMGAHRSAGQGAETIVWLLTEADAGLSGGFYRDCEPIAW